MDSFDAYALTVDEVAAGLISGNGGRRTADAGTLLIVWHGSWLLRDENFRPYIIKDESDDSLHIAWREVGIDLDAQLIGGGESDLNVLDIATSIAMSNHRINLRDVLSGHSAEVVDYIIRAMWHAGGYRD